MQKDLSCWSGKAGFTFSFDNGKIVDYQDHYRNLGDLPFSICYDFETTIGSVVFFNAKMYVVSCCMVVAFHPDLKIPRLVIFQSYDQDQNALTSLSHFLALEFNFFGDPENFNKTTLTQLETAAFLVQKREKNTALAEMFSIELKFTTDCLKNWFAKKHKILDLEIDLKTEFIQNNPLKKDDLCCLCDFPMDPRAQNGWAEHVFRAEHLFLENIYTEKQMQKMGIDKFEYFTQKLNSILDKLDSFCASLEFENRSTSNSDIDEIVEKIKKFKTSKEDDGKATKEKTIAFLYGHSICFIPTNKVKGEFPI